jgi:hypothetical protein
LCSSPVSNHAPSVVLLSAAILDARLRLLAGYELKKEDFFRNFGRCAAAQLALIDHLARIV